MSPPARLSSISWMLAMSPWRIERSMLLTMA